MASLQGPKIATSDGAENNDAAPSTARTEGLDGSRPLGSPPYLWDHLRACAMECYVHDYEAPVPWLTSGIAPPCFGYIVITHHFPQPLIVRGIEKYSSDTKPDHWLRDYLTAIEMTHDNISNVVRHMPLCLTGSACSWFNGLPPNSIHT